MHTQLIQRSILLASLLAAPALLAQTAAAPAPAAPAPPAPLSMPSMSGPLSTAAPATIDAGPFGKLQVTGILSGFAYVQSNKTSDHTKNADISNAQVFVQKTTGLVQFYLQGGAYNLPALGSPFFTTRDTISDFYGAFPQGYIKLAPKGSFSYEAGKLPTLIGAEYTFTFENFNIERGLLWNQENAVNRGIQVNYAKGKLSSSLAWNDGFYSNKYNWLSGMLTYTQNAANAYEFVAMGSYDTNTRSTVATPTLQNNSSIYNLIYTRTGKKYILQPYVQFTYVPQTTAIGVAKSTYTMGGAVLGTYTVSPVFTVAARAEYIGSSGSTTDGSANLMYGPGSKAFSFTVTPTYIKSAFFARADFSVVGATSTTAGDVFGSAGTDTNQVRGLVEAGFMF